MEKKFSKFASFPENPDYEKMIMREKELPSRENDVRSPFMRDYTRILHCTAFRRLKHKTQVFFSPQNDHICTRIEHVLHVESIATSIAISLGLNQELVRAISIGHDLGHSPFGHKGENVLSELYERYLGEKFWHERNSLFVVDKIEMLEDSNKEKKHLDLTYAVRDGIISHCGEAKNIPLIPRRDNCDLYSFEKAGTFMPYTYEACAVRCADKISYVGRDIEDAIAIGIIDDDTRARLYELVGDYTGKKINNTVIIYHLVSDLCNNSSPESSGISFSRKASEFLSVLEDFNRKNIYQSEMVVRADKYFKLVINEIFDLLYANFAGEKTVERLGMLANKYPVFTAKFTDWLTTYCEKNGENMPIFDIRDEKSYIRAILTYISCMTDKYAMETYNDIISF